MSGVFVRLRSTSGPWANSLVVTVPAERIISLAVWEEPWTQGKTCARMEVEIEGRLPVHFYFETKEDAESHVEAVIIAMRQSKQ